MLPTSVPDPTRIPTSSMAILPTSFMPNLEVLPTATKALIPTPSFQTYQNSVDKFEITYKSNRQIYEEQYARGNRHVFYSPFGNITVHVGIDWSWLYPERIYTPDLTVSGQKTFVYDNSSQKIIDFQANGLDYTIQCVHGGSKTLLAECLQFIKDFKLLN